MSIAKASKIFKLDPSRNNWNRSQSIRYPQNVSTRSTWALLIAPATSHSPRIRIVLPFSGPHWNRSVRILCHHTAPFPFSSISSAIFTFEHRAMVHQFVVNFLVAWFAIFFSFFLFFFSFFRGTMPLECRLRSEEGIRILWDKFATALVKVNSRKSCPCHTPASSYSWPWLDRTTR